MSNPVSATHDVETERMESHYFDFDGTTNAARFNETKNHLETYYQLSIKPSGINIASFIKEMDYLDIEVPYIAVANAQMGNLEMKLWFQDFQYNNWHLYNFKTDSRIAFATIIKLCTPHISLKTRSNYEF